MLINNKALYIWQYKDVNVNEGHQDREERKGRVFGWGLKVKGQRQMVAMEC